jgi:hypothetical protein
MRFKKEETKFRHSLKVIQEARPLSRLASADRGCTVPTYATTLAVHEATNLQPLPLLRLLKIPLFGVFLIS